MRLFVLGLPGVGKTSFAKNLADKLGMTWFDLDQYIEKQVGISVAQYFKKYGEDNFRKIESKLLQEVILNHPEVVISTGGGTPCYHDNMKLMKANGICLLLKQPFVTIAAQISNDETVRPLFQGLGIDEILKNLHKIWKERRLYYEQTHIITGLDAVQNPQLLTNRLELFTKRGNSTTDIIEKN